MADAAIEIRSEPAGARVLVDGVARGNTPIVVTGLTAGRHEVQVGGPVPDGDPSGDAGRRAAGCG